MEGAQSRGMSEAHGTHRRDAVEFRLSLSGAGRGLFSDPCSVARDDPGGYRTLAGCMANDYGTGCILSTFLNGRDTTGSGSGRSESVTPRPHNMIGLNIEILLVVWQFGSISAQKLPKNNYLRGRALEASRSPAQPSPLTKI